MAGLWLDEPLIRPSRFWVWWASADAVLPFGLRRQVYRRFYLRSRHWHRTRHAWWVAYPHARCDACGRSWGRMDLHHLSYVHLGAEHVMDLRPLHRSCHQAVHGG